MKFSVLAAALGLGLLASGSAFATDYAASSAAATARPDKAAVEARAQECAREADVRGLKGKERRRFREKCRQGVQ